MRFICLETCKLDDTWGGAEEAVRTNSVVDVLLSDSDALVSLGLGNEAALNLNLILTVGWRLAS